VREKADHDARRTGEAASAKANGIVEEAQRRRPQIEAVIAKLDARRDGALGELERLRGELGATLGEHRSRARSHARSGENGERAQAKPAGGVPRHE
jgi:hypothetical protein